MICSRSRVWDQMIDFADDQRNVDDNRCNVQLMVSFFAHTQLLEASPLAFGLQAQFIPLQSSNKALKSVCRTHFETMNFQPTFPKQASDFAVVNVLFPL